ncbi:hypothetical protein PHYSODRAFT_341970 [Phytophthora sojae]|uniref:Uncharacterized protein n=1 Tax=Phytophthora sojae (strain P6497) TaxID=1094619 RepID=G5AEY1_PHYSP|nr:hypothetical protein PHYSODRAFT_341970 [Phytophthora sojae]EGZ05771.1 hypothetical protein PHYSODRAFT_341970 [Phytophthora sojae]|eukprot:XP_009538632.1 hypothetical protein PHYSODRAFT_341970 [Phytophthora sojae]
MHAPSTSYKLARLTDGEDPLRAVPDSLKLFPYSFASNLPTVSREVPAGATKYPATTVVQPLLRAYYGGCRVREVNTAFSSRTRASCRRTDGLMVHSPDDIPLCSRGDVCVHNYFNSLWDWLNYVAEDQPDRAGMVVNTFRNRYADRVAISVLPGMVVTTVVMQILLMVVYLAQITYYLVYNSDLYLLGLGTGTLTTESVVNLTSCFFAFSYSFVNLVKARSGDQQLDRRFRLTWEAMQPVIIAGVGAMLRSLQREPLQLILSQNAEMLRKYSTRGAKYCGLQDSCIIFKKKSVEDEDENHVVVPANVVIPSLSSVSALTDMAARTKTHQSRSDRASLREARSITIERQFNLLREELHRGDF